MTHRLSLDPPLASADSWAGKSISGLWPQREPPAFAKPRQANAKPGYDKAPAELDSITPLAEHVVLDCLRALKAISPSPHALELMDMISKGYLQAPEHTVRMRRTEALLEISAEEPAS